MIAVVELACQFVVSLILMSHKRRRLLTKWEEILKILIIEKIGTHWYPEEPMKGSGFRAISFLTSQVDPIVKIACAKAKVPELWVMKAALVNFIVFIDPGKASVKVAWNAVFILEKTIYGAAKLVFTEEKVCRVDFDYLIDKPIIPSYCEIVDYQASPASFYSGPSIDEILHVQFFYGLLSYFVTPESSDSSQENVCEKKIFKLKPIGLIPAV